MQLLFVPKNGFIKIKLKLFDVLHNITTKPKQIPKKCMPTKFTRSVKSPNKLNKHSKQTQNYKKS